MNKDGNASPNVGMIFFLQSSIFINLNSAYNANDVLAKRYTINLFLSEYGSNASSASKNFTYCQPHIFRPVFLAADKPPFSCLINLILNL